VFVQKKNGAKVYVGLSGGVDSAVSAALLQKQGYKVVGVFIRIALPGYPCSAGEDKRHAMRVAAHLRMPFVEIDLSQEYQKKVFEVSMREFERGRTPNPDALCNREIKFGLFFDWAMAQGADFVATGHYARIAPENPLLRRDKHDPNSSAKDFPSLLMGIDANKDQSYFLWAVPQGKLAKTLFPVGGLHKAQVRRLAEAFGLPNAARKDSQGLCFLGDISIDDMLHQELVLVPGDVLDEVGAVVGRHEGAQAYTLGQRHGFTLQSTSPHTVPHYVVGKDLEFNTITVSQDKFPQKSSATEVKLSDTNWIGGPASGPCLARFRYRQELIPAELDAEHSAVVLQEPHYVPEGQSMVMYRGEQCLGGGIIEKASLKHPWRSSSTKQTAPASLSMSASSSPRLSARARRTPLRPKSHTT
jgi:tRNA-specific 2-thiouridylase